jgi:hypothetical protein
LHLSVPPNLLRTNDGLTTIMLILNQILTRILCTLSRAFDILDAQALRDEKRRAHNGHYNKHF